MDFRPLHANELPALRRYVERNPFRMADNSLGFLLMWRPYAHTAHAEAEGCLILRTAYGGKTRFAYPIHPDADQDAELRALAAVEAWCVSEGVPLILGAVPAERLPLLTRRYGRDMAISNPRTWRDYLYNLSDFVDYPGRRFAGQRNHVSKFRRAYPQALYRPMTAADVPAVNGFLREYAERQYAKNSFLAKEELHATETLLSMFDDLTQVGGLMEVDGKIAAITVGEVIGDTLIVHVEKALVGTTPATAACASPSSNTTPSASSTNTPSPPAASSKSSRRPPSSSPNASSSSPSPTPTSTPTAASPATSTETATGAGTGAPPGPAKATPATPGSSRSPAPTSPSASSSTSASTSATPSSANASSTTSPTTTPSSWASASSPSTNTTATPPRPCAPWPTTPSATGASKRSSPNATATTSPPKRCSSPPASAPTTRTTPSSTSPAPPKTDPAPAFPSLQTTKLPNFRIGPSPGPILHKSTSFSETLKGLPQNP